MKMPNTVNFTAIKSQARACAKAIRDDIKAQGNVKRTVAYEIAVAKLVPTYYGKVELLCTKMFFMWTIGHVNERWGQENADDERAWG